MSDMQTPYSKYAQKDLILRDLLAIDRTILANERTFLAYIRTALAFLIVGGTLFKFFNSWLMDVGGVIFFVVGIGLFVVGIRRYRMIHNQIDEVRNQQ